ncbi:MAG: DUF885 domain-containing protein [Caulobacterales bacterium]
MRTAVVLILALFMTPALAETRAQRALQGVIATYEAESRLRDPFTAGAEGDLDALSRLPDASRSAELAQDQVLAALQTRIDRVRPAGLSPLDLENLALLRATIANEREFIRLDVARIPFENDSGFFSLPDYLPRQTVIRNAAEAQAYVDRIGAIPAFYEANIANMRRGISTGFVQPRVVLESVLPTLAPHRVTDPASHALYAPLIELPASIAPIDQAALRQAAIANIEAFGSAQDALITFFQAEYRPATRESLGARALPGGEELYLAMARRETTTTMTPEEIQALGVSEVARIRARMAAVIEQTGFRGDFRAFQAMLRSDPRFYARSPEDLMLQAAEMAKRADAGLPRLFGTLPRLPYGVQPVPDSLAPGYTTGRYIPGSIQQGIPGNYWVNTYNLPARPLYELPALTLHEAVPGHHLQIALSQERTDLPGFRRNAFFTAYVEGWGLYAEYLGEEMGFYRTPYEQFGRLSYEMWRACRLVADTGIHWLGWSLEQARQCFDENTALAPHNITTEVLRYVSWPGQALAYKVGELELIRLRRHAEAELGDRFDVRAFHDAVLLDGPVPLDLLAQRIERWIAARKAG